MARRAPHELQRDALPRGVRRSHVGVAFLLAVLLVLAKRSVAADFPIRPAPARTRHGSVLPKRDELRARLAAPPPPTIHAAVLVDNIAGPAEVPILRTGEVTSVALGETEAEADADVVSQQPVDRVPLVWIISTSSTEGDSMKISSDSSPSNDASFASSWGSDFDLTGAPDVDQSTSSTEGGVTSAPAATKAPRLTTRHYALIGLVVLVVPISLIALLVWCVYRRNRYRRKVRLLRLNGTRRPGEVDDADMGQVVRGGDWLDLDGARGGAMPGSIARQRGSLMPVVSGWDVEKAAFDPIGQQAAEARMKKQARRAAVAAAEAAGSPTYVSGGDGDGAAGGVGDGSRVGVSRLAGDGAPGDSEMWSSDLDDDDDECSNGAGIQVSSPNAAAPGSGGGGGGTGCVGSDTTVVPPLSHNPKYFNETARVLLGRYMAENEGAGAATGPLSPGGGGGGAGTAGAAQAQSLRRTSLIENTGGSGGGGGGAGNAFEMILLSAAAPLQLGQEFHQRGENGSGGAPSGPTAAAAGAGAVTPRAYTAASAASTAVHVPRQKSGAAAEEDEEEEEEGGAFGASVGRDGEEDIEDDTYDDEEDEEEEDEEDTGLYTPATGSTAISKVNAARSLPAPPPRSGVYMPRTEPAARRDPNRGLR